MLPDAFYSRLVFSRLLVFSCVLIGCLCAATTMAGEHVVVLTAGKHPLPPSPVQLLVPADLQDAIQLRLKDNATGKAIPVQFNPAVQGMKQSATFIVQKELEAGQTRTYTLSKAAMPALGSLRPEMTVSDKQGARVAQKAGATILRYNASVRQPPANVAEHYRSSGHIHPVRAPDGQPLTSEFPSDHLHQHALFGAWVKTNFKGRTLDFWNQGKQAGRVEHHTFGPTPVQGNAFCQFTAVRRHIATDVAPSEHVLEETWSIKVYNTPDYHLFDIETHQQLAPGVEAPLRIAKYHYGGMALRGRDDWLPGSVSLFSNAASDRLQGNAKPAHWVVMAGKLKDAHGGIAMLSHRDNFRSPQPVRLHPKMPYFCFMPAVVEPFVISLDKPFVSRYRYCAFNGKADVGLIESLSRNFTDLPGYKISIRAVGTGK